MTAFIAPAPTADLRPGPRPTFSVIIPVYQAAETIGDAIASVRAQTFPPAEIIVCDDGSTDDLDAALEAHRGAITILRQDNRGESAARNALIRAARGDFVVPLDADDVFDPTRIERLAELSATRPDLDILATDAYFVVDGQVTGRFNEATPFAVEHQREAILDRCFLILPAVRRLRLLGIGGYDEQLRTAEDWDCCIRLIHAGAIAGLVNEPLLEYRFRKTSLTSKRGSTLVDRVRVLEKVAARRDLTDSEQRVLADSLRRHRSRALQQAARDAISSRDPDAKQRLLAVARSRDIGVRTRGAAALLAFAPVVTRRLARTALSESTGRPRRRGSDSS